MINDEEADESKVFCVMWDIHGLQGIEDITDYEKEAVIATLEMRPPKGQNFLFPWTMRARYNPERNYEIWALKTGGGLTEQSIVQMFDNNPQVAADLIRQKGVRLLHTAGKEPVIR
jgi:hypothetical protein